MKRISKLFAPVCLVMVMISCTEQDKQQSNEIFKKETTTIQHLGDSLKTKVESMSDSASIKIQRATDSAKASLGRMNDSLKFKFKNKISKIGRGAIDSVAEGIKRKL